MHTIMALITGNVMPHQNRLRILPQNASIVGKPSML